VEDLPSFGAIIFRGVLALAAVCAAAYVTLRLLARRAGALRTAGPVRVVARCPLEPRRSIYLVEAAGRCFLVGVGDGSMTTLAELDPTKIAGAEPTHSRRAET
jgi:flagellar biosynthetic protein FliO